ncbi:MAG: hypothetical protein GXZ11_05625 [Tissierellia bacterium]|nr:hypothetical protein [Tissierellia bacterium]
MQQCILSFCNRAQVLELPVPLQAFQTECGQNTYNFTTLEIGDLKAIGGTKLRKLTINSFFPNHKYPFLLSNSHPDPWACHAMIENWRTSKKPLRVVIVGTDINLAMAIESFRAEKKEMDGSGDLYFTLELEEYRFANAGCCNSRRAISPNTGLRNRPRDEVA